MEEKPITEQESLAIIQEMIQKAKNSYIENGVVPLFWGILITFCSLFLYAEIKWDFTIHFDIFLLALIAIIPNVYYSIRQTKARQYTSHTEPAIRAVWLTFVIGIFFTVWYNYATQSNHIPLFLFLYGMPTFITGMVTKFKTMITGGIVCWICAVFSCKINDSTNLLLLALSAICAWLIPGIILRRKYLQLKKKGNV